MGVYWAHLYLIPASIVNELKCPTTIFIWGGNHERKKYHLTKLCNITLPKELGGWGIMDLCRFGGTLLMKSLRWDLFGDGTWSKIIHHKYLKDKNSRFWYRKGTIYINQGYAIWKSFQKMDKIFFQPLAWKFQTGNCILIAVEPILGAREEFSVPQNIKNHLNGQGIYLWGQAISDWQGPLPIWKEAHSLGLNGHMALEWNKIIVVIKRIGIYCRGSRYSITWKGKITTNNIIVADTYSTLSKMSTL